MTIEIEQARDLLLKAVATQGRGFVYNDMPGANCFYEPNAEFDEDSPKAKTGCVVGVALSLAGETRHLGPDSAGMSATGLRAAFPDMMSREAAVYFNRAQGEQDTGATWGRAFDMAETHYRTRSMVARPSAIFFTGI